MSFATYLFKCLEVEVSELVNVVRLVSEHLSGKVMEDVGETLGDWVLLDVFACHSIDLILFILYFHS